MATTGNRTGKTSKPASKVTKLPTPARLVAPGTLMMPTKGVPMPKDGAKWSDSRVSRIAGLDLAAVESFVTQIDAIDIADSGSVDDSIAFAIRQMHSNLGAAASRAAERTGHKFSVNVAPQVISNPFRLIVQGTVTRTC